MNKKENMSHQNKCHWNNIDKEICGTKYLKLCTLRNKKEIKSN